MHGNNNLGTCSHFGCLVAFHALLDGRHPIARNGKVVIDLGSAVGRRGPDIDPNVPPIVAWKSHNYAHFMEQSTIFYAAIMIIEIAGATTPLIVFFAWGYTIIRIVHSLWQATINKVSVRFVLFLLSTLCLAVLAAHALLATI